jgi:hypothetical protein
LATGVEVGVGEGVGFFTVTGLFHTSFLPLFTQVNFLVPTTCTLPSGAQVAPVFGAIGLGAAPDAIGAIARAIEVASAKARILFIVSPVLE